MSKSPGNRTLADECPEPNADWPETWPEANATFAMLFSAMWFLFMAISLIALFVRRNHQPLLSRRVSLLAATTIGTSCVFVVSSVREAIGRDVFPCIIYLAFSTLAPAAILTPIIARLLHHKNRVEFQTTYLQTRTKNVTGADAIALLMTLKFKTRSNRAYLRCAALFFSFVLAVAVYQQLQPRYYIGNGCVGCEMTTGDNTFLVVAFLVLGALCLFALRRLAKLTDGRHREVRDIETVVKAMSAGSLVWILLFRLDPGNVHRNGILSWAYVLDISAIYGIIHLVWVPVYQSYTNTGNQGKMVTLETVLVTPALLECFEEFLKREFAVENIRFVQEVKRWQRAYPGLETASIVVLEEWLDTGSDIYHTFVHEKSLLEVNLNHDIKSRLALWFENSPETTVRPNQKVVRRQSLLKLVAERKQKLVTVSEVKKRKVSQSQSKRTLKDLSESVDGRRHGPPFDLSPDVFNEGVNEIMKLLEFGPFPRFLASKLYAKIQYDSFPSSHRAASFPGISNTTSKHLRAKTKSSVDDENFSLFPTNPELYWK